MASKAQTNGMRGVYLVASELARRGLTTSPTSRSARGADILAVTPDCNRAFSVEVKTTTTNKFWQLAEHAKSIKAKSHIYVFVHVKRVRNGEEIISYYPVSSKFIAQNARLPDPMKISSEQYRPGYSIDLSTIERFKDRWNSFGLHSSTGSNLRIDRR